MAEETSSLSAGIVPLVRELDARFIRTASDELQHDHRWKVWVAAWAPSRRSARVPRLGGIALATPPPTKGLLTRLLAPGWWASLDGHLHDVELVPPQVDPLFKAAKHLPRGPLKDAFVAAVAKARPDVLFQAAEPLFAAIEEGKFILTGLDGLQRRSIPVDFFKSRQWRLRRDGRLMVAATDRLVTLIDVSVVALPAADTSAMGAPTRRGYRESDLSLIDEMREIMDRDKCSVFPAADMVADRAKGSKEPQNRQKRLTRLFYEIYPAYCARP